MLPIDIQPQPAVADRAVAPAAPGDQPSASRQPKRSPRRRPLTQAQRPAIIAGRGAVLADAGAELERLGETIGAVLATSAPANGLFAGLPYALGISGGFASPFAAELLPRADVVLVFGASANHWTTKHGAMIGPNARVIQIDADPRAIGRNRPADLAIIADANAAATALINELNRRGHTSQGFRTTELADADRKQHLAPRPLRGRVDRRVDRPAHGQHRAQRPAPAGPRGRRRLGPLPRLPVDVPRRARRARVAVPERLPGGRARARATRSAPRSPSRTGRRSPRSATAARSWRSPSSRQRRG